MNMILIMLGAPGTGKGTVAGILSKELGIVSVSSGDIFRKAISEKTELGKEVEGYLAKGALVPDELTIRVIEARLLEPDLENGVILDGFPRTTHQAEELEKFLNENGKSVTKVINLVTPEEEIVERIVNRRICSNQNCKTVFNMKLNPPKVTGVCDECGGELIQRKDDTEEVIKSRLNTYYTETAPIEKFYEEKGLLYSTQISQKVNRLAPEVAKDVVELLK